MRDQKQSKLDEKKAKYIFTRYDSSCKGYKLYNPNNGNVVVSRDIKFNEGED